MHAPSTPVPPPGCCPPSQNRSQRLHRGNVSVIMCPGYGLPHVLCVLLGHRRHFHLLPLGPLLTTFSSCSPPESSAAFILMTMGHPQRRKFGSNTQVMTAVLRRAQAPARNERSRPWAIRVASRSRGPRERPPAQEVLSSGQRAVRSSWATKNKLRGTTLSTFFVQKRCCETRRQKKRLRCQQRNFRTKQQKKALPLSS